jgi:hypothetical protein
MEAADEQHGAPGSGRRTTQPKEASRRMTNNQASPLAPLVVAEKRLEPWLQHDWQKFWLTIRSREWKSLALVPAGVGGPADFTVTVAVSLARTGMTHLGVPIRVADATRVPLRYMVQFLDEVRNCTAAGDLVLIALGAMAESPVTVSVAQASDNALLCVLLEKMAAADAKKVVGHVGAQRFIGSAVFHPRHVQ